MVECEKFCSKLLVTCKLLSYVKPGHLEIFVCIYDYTSCSNGMWCTYHRQTSTETADESQGTVVSPISSVGLVCSTGSVKRSDYRLGSSKMMALC
jgi:hypothetical protein